MILIAWGWHSAGPYLSLGFPGVQVPTSPGDCTKVEILLILVKGLFEKRPFFKRGAGVAGRMKSSTHRVE